MPLLAFIANLAVGATPAVLVPDSKIQPKSAEDSMLKRLAQLVTPAVASVGAAVPLGEFVVPGGAI